MPPKAKTHRPSGAPLQSGQTLAAAVAAAELPPPSLEVTNVGDAEYKLLHDSARLGLLDEVMRLCSSTSQANIDSAFITAAECGHGAVVERLSQLVSSVDVKTADENTPLILAARNGHYDAAVVLINAGAHVDHRNAKGLNALMSAVQSNNAHIASLLIERTANVNAVDAVRNSVLHCAASGGSAPMLALLLRNGALTSVLNDKDETPLEVAKNAEMCRLILESNAHSASFPSSSALSTAPETSPHMIPAMPTPISPFRELPSGASSLLFWTAMGVGKDSYMFQNFGVYPFDRLNDTERIIVLTEVAEAMSGYKTDLQSTLLNESALFAVFALMKARIKKELDEAAANTSAPTDAMFVWRRRVLEAYEQVYQCSASAGGLSVECWKRSVWNTVVNLLSRSLFGESFWEKKRMFLSPNGLERTSLVKHFAVPASYFQCKLPSTASIEIQLTFKKLITMSKTFLSDEPVRPSGCFCQDCIAELEVPLTFKLQFLEEAAEEKRKMKGKQARRGKDKQRLSDGGLADDDDQRTKLDELIVSHRKELRNFWSSISIEEKWSLTEMSTIELSDLITNTPHWETLRAALDSYVKYAWEEDVLEISEDCVTIADDMCEEKGMNDILDATLSAVGLEAQQIKAFQADPTRFADSHAHTANGRNGAVRCLTSDHDVLTDVGWKAIADVTRHDRVLSFNPDSHVAEWKKVIDRDHRAIDLSSTKLFRIQNEQVDCVVNGDHKWLLNDTLTRESCESCDGWRWHATTELYKLERNKLNRLRLPAAAILTKTRERKHFTFSALTIPIDNTATRPLIPPTSTSALIALCRLIGFILVSGGVDTRRQRKTVFFRLDNSNARRRSAVEAVIAGIPTLAAAVTKTSTHNDAHADFHWDNESFVKLIAPMCALDLLGGTVTPALIDAYKLEPTALGTIIDTARCRRLSEWAFTSLSFDQQRALLDGMAIADVAARDMRVDFAVATSSVRLRDDVMRLAAYCALSSSAMQMSAQWKVILRGRVDAVATAEVVCISRPTLLAQPVDPAYGTLYGITVADNANFLTRRFDSVVDANGAATVRGAAYFTGNSDDLSLEEWDKRGRQMLENSVLAEFARKIAHQYLLRKQESRAQQVALELELELQQEELNGVGAAKKSKAKKKRAKTKSKSAKSAKLTPNEMKKRSLPTAAEADNDDHSADEPNGEDDADGRRTQNRTETVPALAPVIVSTAPSVPAAISTLTATASTAHSASIRKQTKTRQNAAAKVPPSLSASPSATPAPISVLSPVTSASSSILSSGSDDVDGVIVSLTREQFSQFSLSKFLPINRAQLANVSAVRVKVTNVFVFTPDHFIHGVWTCEALFGEIPNAAPMSAAPLSASRTQNSALNGAVAALECRRVALLSSVYENTWKQFAPNANRMKRLDVVALNSLKLLMSPQTQTPTAPPTQQQPPTPNTTALSLMTDSRSPSKMNGATAHHSVPITTATVTATATAAVATALPQSGTSALRAKIALQPHSSQHARNKDKAQIAAPVPPTPPPPSAVAATVSNSSEWSDNGSAAVRNIWKARAEAKAAETVSAVNRKTAPQPPALPTAIAAAATTTASWSAVASPPLSSSLSRIALTDAETPDRLTADVLANSIEAASTPRQPPSSPPRIPTPQVATQILTQMPPPPLLPHQLTQFNQYYPPQTAAPTPMPAFIHNTFHHRTLSPSPPPQPQAQPSPQQMFHFAQQQMAHRQTQQTQYAMHEPRLVQMPMTMNMPTTMHAEVYQSQSNSAASAHINNGHSMPMPTPMPLPIPMPMLPLPSQTHSYGASYDSFRPVAASGSDGDSAGIANIWSGEQHNDAAVTAHNASFAPKTLLNIAALPPIPNAYGTNFLQKTIWTQPTAPNAQPAQW